MLADPDTLSGAVAAVAREWRSLGMERLPSPTTPDKRGLSEGFSRSGMPRKPLLERVADGGLLIAPRRSPVRVRLAPSHEVLHVGAFLRGPMRWDQRRFGDRLGTSARTSIDSSLRRWMRRHAELTSPHLIVSGRAARQRPRLGTGDRASHATKPYRRLAAVNRRPLIGTLTDDPELRKTPSWPRGPPDASRGAAAEPQRSSGAGRRLRRRGRPASRPLVGAARLHYRRARLRLEAPGGARRSAPRSHAASRGRGAPGSCAPFPSARASRSTPCSRRCRGSAPPGASPRS